MTPTTRRQLLRLGVQAGAVLAVAGVSGCSTAPRPSGPRRARVDPTFTPADRFAGDPGPGRLFFGTSVAYDQPADRSPDFRHLRISMTRRFYRPDQVPVMLRACRSDQRAGILPFVSVKLRWSWASVASGVHDGWLQGLLDGLGHPRAPVMLAVHHEPENDTTDVQTAAAWVAMQQRVLEMARRRARTVTVVPVLMQYTFDPASGRSPGQWLVPEAPVQGIDIYNPWRPSSGVDWIGFPEMLARVRTVIGERPVVVPEYGCLTDEARVGRTRDWFLDAFAYALVHDVVGMAYFDSALGSGGQSWVLDDVRRSALEQLSARGEIAMLDAPA